MGRNIFGDNSAHADHRAIADTDGPPSNAVPDHRPRPHVDIIAKDDVAVDDDVAGDVAEVADLHIVADRRADIGLEVIADGHIRGQDHAAAEDGSLAKLYAGADLAVRRHDPTEAPANAARGDISAGRGVTDGDYDLVGCVQIIQANERDAVDFAAVSVGNEDGIGGVTEYFATKATSTENRGPFHLGIQPHNPEDGKCGSATGVASGKGVCQTFAMTFFRDRCPSCGAELFMPRIGTGVIHITNSRQICGKCNAVMPIAEGTYSYAESALKSFRPYSPGELYQFQMWLNRTLSEVESKEEIATKARAETPEMAPLLDLFLKLGGPGLLVALIALYLQFLAYQNDAAEGAAALAQSQQTAVYQAQLIEKMDALIAAQGTPEPPPYSPPMPPTSPQRPIVALRPNRRERRAEASRVRQKKKP